MPFRKYGVEGRNRRYMLRPMRYLARLLLASSLAAASGCSTLLWETGLPWTQASFRVTSVERRGPFLDVMVASGGIERRFFVRGTDPCRELLRRDAEVTLRQTEAFVGDDLECPVAGIGNLEQLRGSRSRGGGYGSRPIRRGNDRIHFVYQDEQYRYARGGFSIGAMFGWAPGTDQVVALLPLIPECSPLVDGQHVSVIFRQTGTPALSITAGPGACPVRGLIAVQREDFQQVE